MKPKRVKEKLKTRQQSYELTKKNQDRTKYSEGFHKPGSLNVHKS